MGNTNSADEAYITHTETEKKAPKIRNTSVLPTRQLGSLWSSNENTVTIREQLTNNQTSGDGTKGNTT
jgi:hypothetical protein